MVQVSVVGRVSRALGDRRTLVTGLGLAALGLAGAALARTVPMFIVALAPAALGMGLASPTLLSLISTSVPPGEQGLAQGAAGALESLGRTAGPVFGNSMLQHFGEGSAYGAGALVLLTTMAIAACRQPRPRRLPAAVTTCACSRSMMKSSVAFGGTGPCPAAP